MSLDPGITLERVLTEGDEWQSWRALSLSGEAPGDPPDASGQDPSGAFLGPSGRPSPGATGEALCHLVIAGLADSGACAIAADWLEEARTPAGAWLDSPDEVPGDLYDPAGARVWATASACCGLLACIRDPGPRAAPLLRGEADMDGRFTGGAYPTFAAAGAFWLIEGPQGEMAEWALRWAREWPEDWWGPEEWVSALTFWGAAGIPPEHASVEALLRALREDGSQEGWRDDLELSLRALELLDHFED
ncbi:MAG: hypothetical protein M3345_07580 [Actinomycetota bacterium]|nr:hypothetical protein [Actinomycetota bacterium]